jgi:hypothetical protein
MHSVATQRLVRGLILRGIILRGIVALSCLCATATVHAQEADQDLASKATDPTASLMAFNFITGYTGAFHGPDVPGERDDQWTLKFQPAIPFKAFGHNNIMRVVLPYQVGGRGDEGMGDVTVFDVVTFDRSWGRFAVGAVASFASDDNAPDRFSIGPAVGAVKPVNKKLNVGVFSQNLFADNTAITQLQPVVAYQLGHGWALSAGDLQFTYDWKRSRWLNVPIGAQLGKVFKLGSQPMRWSINPQYNLKDDPGLSQWSVSFTLTMLVPGG